MDRISIRKNLWELITRAAGDERREMAEAGPGATGASSGWVAFKKFADSRRQRELSLEAFEDGTWLLVVHCTGTDYENDSEIMLRVDGQDRITLTTRDPRSITVERILRV